MGKEEQDPTADELNAFYKRMFDSLGKISFRVEMVTPKKAIDYLSRNVQNRPRTDARIRGYARQIIEGKWKVNGQAVIFDEDDQLMDGQGRLAAIELAEVAVPICVIRGVPRSAFDTLDTGKVRNASDILHISGEKNSTSLAAALRWVYLYEHGIMRGTTTYSKPTPAETAMLLQQFPSVRDSLEFVQPKCKRGQHPAGPMAFLHAVASRNHRAKADVFFGQVLTQIGLAEGAPSHAFHEQLVRRAAAKRKMSMVEILGIGAKCWNDFISGKKARGILKLTDDEAFPTIL